MTTFVVLLITALLIMQSKRLHREQALAADLRERSDLDRQRPAWRSIHAAHVALERLDADSRVEFTVWQDWPKN